MGPGSRETNRSELDLTVAIQNISQREKTSGNFFCHFISNKTKENTDHNKTSEVKISCVLFPDFREAPHCQHDEQEKSLEDPQRGASQWWQSTKAPRSSSHHFLEAGTLQYSRTHRTSYFSRIIIIKWSEEEKRKKKESNLNDQLRDVFNNVPKEAQ